MVRVLAPHTTHTALAEIMSFVSIILNSLSLTCDGRRIVPKRWIVSRPYDPDRRVDACVLQIRRECVGV